MKRNSVFFGLLLFGLTGLAQANLITNGDFQTGDLTGWDHATPGNVWVTTGSGGNSIARFDVDGGNGDARLYQNFDVDPLWDGISIGFKFRLNTGTSSTADFFKSFVRLEIDGGPDSVNTLIKVTDSTDGWQQVWATVLFDGLTIDPVTPNARLTFLLKEHTGDWAWARLDNVEAYNVPEPATLALLGLGLTGIGFARKKKLS